MSANNLIYTLDLWAENCHVLATLNGFPAYDLYAKHLTNFARPINSLLTGLNRIKISIIPLSADDLSANVSCKCYGSVKQYVNGAISAPESGTIIHDISVDGFGVQEIQFRNLGLDFSKTFYELAPIETKEELYMITKKLMDFYHSKDGFGLLPFFRPKLEEMSLAYNESLQGIDSEFLEFMQNAFFKLGIVKCDVENEIQYTPWCDKRIWSIERIGSTPLFQTQPDENDDNYSIDIFIANIDGNFCVIR